MGEPRCICSLLGKSACRVHDEGKKAAFQWADGYFTDNVDVLGLELFHREMLEVAYISGRESKIQSQEKEIEKWKTIAEIYETTAKGDLRPIKALNAFAALTPEQKKLILAMSEAMLAVKRSVET